MLWQKLLVFKGPAGGIMKQRIYLIRHGETEWTISDRHTGLTDLPLTSHGQQQALALGDRLRDHPFKRVFVSPLQRALKTAAIAGFVKQAEIDPDLVEWNYGDYEGRKTEDILKEDPSWSIFTKGAPGGESIADIQKRAHRVLKKVQAISGDVALFSSGHFLRVFTACYLGMTAAEGRYFLLSTASVSILGYEKDNKDSPVIVLWNSIQT